jgi:hypothetical protein
MALLNLINSNSKEAARSPHFLIELSKRTRYRLIVSLLGRRL